MFFPFLIVEKEKEKVSTRKNIPYQMFFPFLIVEKEKEKVSIAEKIFCIE